MTDLIRPILDQYVLASQMVSRGLADLSNPDASRRMRKGAGSSIAFVTGHLLSSRAMALGLLGVDRDNPYRERFAQPSDDVPPIGELKQQWDRQAQRLHNALGEAPEQHLRTELPKGVPAPERTVFGNLKLLAWHEAYHVGQIGLMRTELGYPPLQQLMGRKEA